MIIDLPSPFAPRAEWIAFLAEMEALLVDNPDDADVIAAIVEARATLSETATT